MPTYEKSELLLKSALEKIVYFEARQEQLLADAKRAITEAQTLRQQLESAKKRELESSRALAEMEARLRHMQSERDEAFGRIETLRRERAEWVGKILEAAQIQNPTETVDGFDLPQFIALLRGELLNIQNSPQPLAPTTHAVHADTTLQRTLQPQPQSTEAFGAHFAAQGRLDISAEEQTTLQAHEKPLANHVLDCGLKELFSADANTRLRTALRLKALGRPSAGPALGRALHSETNPQVLVALIDAFSSFAKTEGLPLVSPYANSADPKLRLAAVKALIRMDPQAATPQLLAALEDSDAHVRRRATLWLMGLSREETLRLGSAAFEDKNPNVRAIATYVLSASQQEAAKPQLMRALHDENLKVRNAAAKTLSQFSKADWTFLPSLEQAERQRALRRLKYPNSQLAAMTAPTTTPLALQPKTRCTTLTVEPQQATQQAMQQPVQQTAEQAMQQPMQVVAADEALSEELLNALRTSLRGKTLDELLSLTQATPYALSASLFSLEKQQQIIRRGQKYFIA